MHFHRDLLVIADGYAREVLGVTPDDIFVGSPPLAFTFGLGGLAIFPLRFGAAGRPPRRGDPAEHGGPHRATPGEHRVHRAHRLPRHAGRDGRGGGPHLAPPRGIRGGDPACADLRSMDLADREAHPGRDRHHRAPPHLHLEPCRGGRGGLDRRPRHRVRGAYRRRGRRGAAARGGPAASRSAARPAAAISAAISSRSTSRAAGT